MNLYIQSVYDFAILAKCCQSISLIFPWVILLLQIPKKFGHMQSLMRTPAGNLRDSFISYPGPNNYSFPCYYFAFTVCLYLNLNVYISFIISHNNCPVVLNILKAAQFNVSNFFTHCIFSL